jgi:hypothetical protein
MRQGGGSIDAGHSCLMMQPQSCGFVHPAGCKTSCAHSALAAPWLKASSNSTTHCTVWQCTETFLCACLSTTAQNPAGICLVKRLVFVLHQRVRSRAPLSAGNLQHILSRTAALCSVVHCNSSIWQSNYNVAGQALLLTPNAEFKSTCQQRTAQSPVVAAA